MIADEPTAGVRDLLVVAALPDHGRPGARDAGTRREAEYVQDERAASRLDAIEPHMFEDGRAIAPVGRGTRDGLASHTNRGVVEPLARVAKDSAPHTFLEREGS